MVDREDHQPIAVRDAANDFLQFAVAGSDILPVLWRIGESYNADDCVYEYSGPDGVRQTIVRVHWHTCCQDHPHQVTRVEVIRGT